MPFYHKLGEVPRKRHTQFRRPDGALYAEELVSLHGFSDISSLLYHYHLPTQVTRLVPMSSLHREAWPGEARHHHLRTGRLPAGGDAVDGRWTLLYNADLTIATLRPTASMSYFYRNADGDELFFVHSGEGRLVSPFGEIVFGPGDYLVVPRGTLYRIELRGEGHRFLLLEANGHFQPPRRYRNDKGQFLETAPYCERDIRPPQNLETHTETGEFEVRVKMRGELFCYQLGHHPCDVVGWDGYVYPWAFNLADFEPITGRLHQPPPVHQVFEGPNCVVCNFVPRKLDYHPQAVPAPYNHANVDCDEVLYYVSGNFLSRRGIEAGSLTWHPGGIPHGPQPGMAEASLAATETDEVAVMIDTFQPLEIAAAARDADDPSYPYSWAGE